MPDCAFIRKLKRCKLFRRVPKSSTSPDTPLDQVTKPDGPVVTATISGKPESQPQTDGLVDSKQLWSTFASTLRKVVDSTFPGVLSPLESAMKVFLEFVNSMEDTKESYDEYKELASELMKTIELLRPQLNDLNYDSLSVSITETVESIAADVEKIMKERDYAMGRRYDESQRHYNEIRRWWNRINGTLRNLDLQLRTETNIILIKSKMDKRLALLNPVKSALYGSEPGGVGTRQYCADGTRERLFQDLNTWYNTSSSRVLWINGMAGTGKTTIAHTYAKILSDNKKLTACFFCSRVDQECRSLNRIIPTIVHQLARLSVPFRDRLLKSLEENSDRASLTNITEQFKTLLEAPFGDVNLSEDITVIIDALDECDEPEPGAMNVFWSHLVQYAGKLPLKFLVTSRPEIEFYGKDGEWCPIAGGAQEQEDGAVPQITPGASQSNDIMESTSKLDKSKISLHEMDEELVRVDIKLYLEQNFAPMLLSNEVLMCLVERCGMLFIYAATLVRYIKPWKSSSSRLRLENVLQLNIPPNATIYTELNLLYDMVLRNAFGDGLDNAEKANMRMTLDTVLCAKESINIKTIAALCGFDDEVKGAAALEQLASVIHVSDTTGFVSVFHSSFPDFMFDSNRAGKAYCDRAKHSHIMVQECFRLMEELQFNICKLDSSYIADEKAKIDVDKTIEPPLWYACRYWAEHLAQTTENNLCVELESFLSQRFLFWMEALNIKRKIAVGGDALLQAGSWLTERKPRPDDLIAFIEDAKNFLASFAASPVSISTPHIYTSLLPFCPRSSAIFKHYRERFRDLVEPDERTIRVREVAALAIWKDDVKVLSVAYSHDGLSIAFGCRDGTVRVHRSYDNTHTFGNEEDPGHNRPVWSVAFSPNKDKSNGRVYLASGSDDGTIRIWNLDGTVRSVCPPGPHPPTTNPSGIKSIAFSPKCDGTIASGSSDCTVCIWDSFNHELIADPFRGHKGEIWSVAFSPDGDLVASGSDDYTIRIWNLKGELVLGPLAQGGEINSISFSPDGTRMAFGSSDKTVCVWDPKHRKVVTPPFAAHNGKVSCVKFSSDGKYLASSSHDRTIRVWDPLDGKLIAGPFEGHIGPVYSIAFSPDDTRIISGSPDGTIRLWDPRRKALGDDVLTHHTEAVSSVAFSPDGQHMASCSYDGTVRVWDVGDNLPVTGGTPLITHNRKMASLAFSSDGAWVVTGSLDHKARVWDIRHPGTPIATFEEHSGPIWSITFSHDRNNSFVASGGGKGDNSIRLWNPSEGTSISDPLTGHTDEVLSVAISPDNLHLASASRDKTIRVWDLKNNTKPWVLDRHTRAVWSVVYSHDGSKIASGSSDGTIIVWNFKSQNIEVITTLAHDNVPNSKWISSVAFSPDDSFIASSAEHTVRLWYLSTGDLVKGPYEFEGHRDTVWSVAFSPSGTRIVSGSHDGTIRFWDIATIMSEQSTGANAIADEWKIDIDGWITQNSNLLLWVPHEVARSLLTPYCSSVITSSGPLRVDFSSRLKLGTSWKECYIPRSNKYASV